MDRLRRLTQFLAIASLCLVRLVTYAQVSVTTYHNDNARTGQNTLETVLTTSNVNASSFGKLFRVPVDGQIYAQPLVLSNLSIGGGTHNVVYVATEHDSVYAVDADNGTTYWRKGFINPAAGVTTDPNNNCPVLRPEIGITSTPVIDAVTGTIYVVAKTLENGYYFYRVHALDVVTGNEKFGGPVVIAATVGSDTFTAKDQLNRSALLLENGKVLMGFGSTGCDNGPYHGWVLAYNASNLAQIPTIFDVVPNGSQAAVWMSGNGVASDANGNIFFATGNGTYDGRAGSDYGNSIIRLNPSGGAQFSVGDWFTPYNWDALRGSDLDVGAGGVLLLPDLPSGSAHQHLLVQAGKNGTIYLLDRDNMVQNCGMPPCIDRVVQELPGALVGMWGSPAYWNAYVYFGSATDSPATSDSMKAYSLNAGGNEILSGHAVTSTVFAWPGPTPSTSSNGTTSGIVWALDNSSYGSSCCAVLHAYDATNLMELYNSSMNSTRDHLGGAIRFSVPTIANGKVYVGNQNYLTALGTNPPPPPATVIPTSLSFSYNACTGVGNANPQTVTLNNNSPGALVPASFTIQGAGFSIDPGGTCAVGKPVQPGNGCTLLVGYGDGTGSSIATLYINDSASNSPQMVNLHGVTNGGRCGPCPTCINEPRY